MKWSVRLLLAALAVVVAGLIAFPARADAA